MTDRWRLDALPDTSVPPVAEASAGRDTIPPLTVSDAYQQARHALTDLGPIKRLNGIEALAWVARLETRLADLVDAIDAVMPVNVMPVNVMVPGTPTPGTVTPSLEQEGPAS